MKFIIQHNMLREVALQEVLKAVQPFPHEFVGVIPFSHEITSDQPLDGIDYLPYGSTLMIRLVKELGWRGVHFDMDTFNYRAAVLNRDDMLNNQYILTAAETIQFMLNEAQGAGTEWFIRPSHDLKQFNGQVIEAAECAKWLTGAIECESSTTQQIPADTDVVIATPKDIGAEWRYFIVGGEVVDGSMYRYRGRLQKEHEEDKAVLREAQTFANKWLPDECCVMDLALVNSELKVIEFNCINGSGFYNHNVPKIFEALWEYHKDKQ